MTQVRYFAAAEEFAGRATEQRDDATLGALRRTLAADYPALGAILPRCAVLVDGRRSDDERVTAREARAGVPLRWPQCWA